MHLSALSSCDLMSGIAGGSIPKYYDDRLKQAASAKKKASAKRGPVSTHPITFFPLIFFPKSSSCLVKLAVFGTHAIVEVTIDPTY